MTQRVVPLEVKMKIVNLAPPFCQMIGRNISVQSCLEAQGQEKCFGCAAPSRLCELCQEQIVDVPALGRCSTCLTYELSEEALGKTIPVGLTQVDCQIQKKAINVEMCKALQGQEACSNCSARSRLCEKCKQNPCQISLYGLCLRCSIEEYGDGWEPLSEIEVSDIVKLKVNQRWQTQLETAPTAQEITKDRQEKIALAELLIPKAAELIRNKGQVSLDLLVSAFQIDADVARHLLDFLLEEGIIDAKEHRLAQQKTVNYNALSIKEKISRLGELIKVIGDNAEFSDLLHSVIADLKQWDSFKKVLKKNAANSK